MKYLLVNSAEGSQSEPAMPFMQPALSENKIETIVHWVEQNAGQGDVGTNE